MYRLIITLIFCFLIQQTYAGNLLVLNTVGKPPLNTPEQSGFMDRVTAEALSRIGYQMQVIALPAERGLRNVNAGIDDGEMSRIEGMEKIYPNLVRVPERLMTWEFCVFTNSPIDFNGKWDDLKPYNVSFINGWKILEEKVPHQTNVFTMKYPEQLFSLLEKQRTDLVIYERWGGLQLVRTKGYTDIHILLPPLVARDVFIYLNKKHSDLVPQLSHALAEMKQDGSYRKIYNDTLGPLITRSTQPE